MYTGSALYQLGTCQASLWAEYLQRLEAAGIKRRVGEAGPRVKRLYFARLVGRLGCSHEEITLPGTVCDVQSLLNYLRARGGEWDTCLQDSAVNVAVNRAFTKPDPSLKESDEVAIVPNHPD